FTPDGASHAFTQFGSGVLAFDLAGNLFVGVVNEITKYTSAGAQSVFVSGLTSVGSLAFDCAGNLFAGDVSPRSIFKFSGNGTKTTFASSVLAASLAFEPVTEKLRNISARGLVGTGDDVLIGGFIVGGNGLTTNAVVVRAIGPSLSQSGVTNSL